MADAKPVHSLVLDAGPIIKNEPNVSSLRQISEALFTTPAVIAEIKDASARSRITTTLQPFLTQRSPLPTSVKLVADFARKTGDFAVLSKTDIEIIALTYELECERNSGNWRLRSAPGQKGLNGRPPIRPESDELLDATPVSTSIDSSQPGNDAHTAVIPPPIAETTLQIIDPKDTLPAPQTVSVPLTQRDTADTVENEQQALDHISGRDSQPAPPPDQVTPLSNSLQRTDLADADNDVSSSDSEGWITPTNLKKRQAQDASGSVVSVDQQTVMQAAVLTTDFAMQNVILQMNLNLLSSSLQRVKHLKTFVLRCHACFQTTKDMAKQFCPRCGGPTLTRVSCSTNANGEFKLHLKKNMQWNHRGERYSIPKPQHGSANGRNKGGGKEGWGHSLILTEDQKEFERAGFVERKQKEKSLMDDDYLPSILTGDRSNTTARTKVGAGRNVNSRKR